MYVKYISMKTQHLFEDHIYLISNHSVAKNPMFSDPALQHYFIDKMEKYLSPICKIIANCLNDNEFQLLVKLKNREAFEQHYLSKNKDYDSDKFGIPESTYIFSQAMANLQVSFVKHFNWKFSRSGTLVAGRFQRDLVKTESDMLKWIEKLNAGIKRHRYADQWINVMKRSDFVVTSSWLYGLGDCQVKSFMTRKFGAYFTEHTDNLGACFESLPPQRLSSSKNYFLHQINQLYHKNGLANQF